MTTISAASFNYFLGGFYLDLGETQVVPVLTYFGGSEWSRQQHMSDGQSYQRIERQIEAVLEEPPSFGVNRRPMKSTQEYQN